MILVFDLDDTLYPEETYVWSGFAAVADYLSQHRGIERAESLAFMQGYYPQYQRQGILDALLKHVDCYSPSLVQSCLRAYRTHRPRLALYPEAKACLDRFRALPRYLVTDGNKVVQHRKVQALGLQRRFRHCYLTYRYGVKHSKPSPYCFRLICQREKVAPEQVVYIGDNPHKDFIGIKPLGFRTIRVLQGPYRDLQLSPAHEAQRSIPSLAALTWELLKGL